MINHVLQIVSTMLNEHIKQSMNVDEEKCIVSNLINLDKSIPTDIHDKVVLSFLNIEESHLSNVAIGYKGGVQNTDLKRLDISILVSFNLNSYNDSLVYLTSVFAYLQSNPLLYAQDDDQVSAVSKLTLELLSTNTETQANIWSFIGSPYIPSLIYKMRVLYRSQINSINKIPIASI